MEIKRTEKKTDKEFLPIAALATTPGDFQLTAEDFEGVEPLSDAQIRTIQRSGENTVLGLKLSNIVICERFNNRKFRNPRTQELVYQGIKADGQATPCTINTVEWGGKTYAFLTSGFGRADAVRRINAERGPNEKEVLLKCNFRGDNNAQARMRNIKENVERSDISNLDIAAGALELMSLYGLSQAQVAGTYNVSQATISQLLKLNRLTPFWKQQLFERKIGEGQAKKIAEKDWDEKNPQDNIDFQNDLEATVKAHLTENSPEITKKMVEQEVVKALDTVVAGAAAAGAVVRWAKNNMVKPGLASQLSAVARAIARFETVGDKSAEGAAEFEASIMAALGGGVVVGEQETVEV